MDHWKATLRLWAVVLLAFFVGHTLDIVRADSESKAGTITNQDSAISKDDSNLSQCRDIIIARDGTVRDKQSLADTFQKAFMSVQGPQAQISANLATCMAKMNPAIREQISVIPVGFGTQSANGRVNDPKGLVIAYMFELFIITNEPERIFNGDLKCDKDFTFLNGPDLTPRNTVTASMRSGTPPRFIAPNEYLITVDATGTEWNPSHPAFMTIRTTDKALGCTFTPQE